MTHTNTHTEKGTKNKKVTAFFRFLCENFWLDKHVRYIVVPYPVVILWLVGTLSYSDSPGSQVFIFVGQCLTLSPLYAANQCFID